MKFYSLASVQASRLPALHAALVATVAHDRLNVRVAYSTIPAETVDSNLRNLKGVPWPFTWTFVRGDVELEVKLSALFTVIMVEITGTAEEEEKKVDDLVRDTLALKPPSDHELRGVATDASMNQVLWTIHDQIEKLQSTLTTTGARNKLRCFISFRFDDHSKALALELREFLELVDVEFVSGLGFEPRSVSAKVLARLSGQLDLFVIIHSLSGDSAWLNQEIGVARARNLPVVVLREGEVPYEPGMLGDTEYIQFPEHAISKAHVPLLQAIRFLREGRMVGA